MKNRSVLALLAAASITVALAGCAAPTPVVPPVVVNTGDIQGSTVEVPINSMLVLNTGSLPVDSYSADIADSSIAEFVQGKDDGSATFNPGLKPLKVGETEVTLSNEQGGIQDVKFTLQVVPAAGAGNLGGAGK